MNVLIPGRRDQQNDDEHGLIMQQRSTDSEALIPLRKAINLLLRIQQPSQKRSHRDPSDPVARAQASLQAADPNDVYSLLRERFLHRDEAAFSLAKQIDEHQPAAFMDLLEQELSIWDDKRRQLAALLVLHHLRKSTGKEAIVATKYSQEHQQPTLIACAACDVITASTLSEKAQVETVLGILERWRKTQQQQKMDPIEQAGWQQLHTTLMQSEDNDWRLILPWLQTKYVLSTKPLSPKRRAAILETRCSKWMKLAVFAVLKKGNWVGEEIERQLLDECLQKNGDASSSSNGHPLLAQMMLCAPNLFDGSRDISRDLVYHLVQQALLQEDDEKYPDSLIAYMLQQPADAMRALVQGIQQDNKKSFELTGALVRNAASSLTRDEIGSAFAEQLLPLVARSHSACEALITCMDIIDLPALTLRLMAMTNTADPRAGSVCKGLIAKALLSKRWADGYGLLIFIDMVRDFKHARQFTSDCKVTNIKSPSQLMDSMKKAEKEEQHCLSDQQVFELSMGLLSTVHLWSMKAPREAIENGLRQLVIKTYAAPSDDTFLTAWHYLSPAFAKHSSEIWSVLQAVSKLLREQPRPRTTQDESLVYARVSPLLILKSIPETCFADVRLYHTVTGWTDDGLQFAESDIKWTREPFEHQDTSRILFEELLARVQHSVEYDVVRQLAQEMLKKIFVLAAA